MDMDTQQRIERFKQMADGDPTDDMARFGLGRAYLEAGEFDQAVAALRAAVELNPKLSKAFQLLGRAHKEAGRTGDAVDVLTRGVKIADEQGDRMPRDAMADLLRELGAEVPAFREAPAPAAGGVAAAPGFRCSRCGAPGPQLPKPPFRNELGQRIFKNVCNNCWREWIPTGTKVINEFGLVLSDPRSQATYDQCMVEFLQIEEA